MQTAVNSTIRLGMLALFSTLASLIFAVRLFYFIRERQWPWSVPLADLSNRRQLH
jgi:hypothetical protein